MALSVLNFTNRIISVIRIRPYKSIGGRRFIAPLMQGTQTGGCSFNNPLMCQRLTSQNRPARESGIGGGVQNGHPHSLPVSADCISSCLAIGNY